MNNQAALTRLLDLLAGPAWMRDAACAGTDPRLWFPDTGDDGAQAAAAKQVCAGCPVRAACASFAEDSQQKYGIWGGLGERDRKRLRRQSRRDHAA